MKKTLLTSAITLSFLGFATNSAFAKENNLANYYSRNDTRNYNYRKKKKKSTPSTKETLPSTEASSSLPTTSTTTTTTTPSTSSDKKEETKSSRSQEKWLGI